MKKNVTGKNLLRTIKGSLGRYVAIMAIIALGAAMFVGLVITKSDMVATGQKFMDRQHMFDLHLLSTYGWSIEDLEAIRTMDGVEYAEGNISLDVLGCRGEDNTAVYKLHALPEQVDMPLLLGGRMPQNPDECLVDGFHATDAVLGTTFTVTADNEQAALDQLLYHTYTVVGYVSSPLYMDMSRGTTTLGNGTVSSYVYLPRDAFQTDYYTDISVTMEGNYSVYTQEFDDAMQAFADSLSPAVQVLADHRYGDLKTQGEKEYEEGMAEYQQGLQDYENGREQVRKELEEAFQKLSDAQKEIDENRTKLEDGQIQLDNAQKELEENRKLLNDSRKQMLEEKAAAYEQLAQARAEILENYKKVYPALQQVNDGLSQLDAGLAQITDAIAQIEDGLTQMEEGRTQLELVISLKKTQVDALKAALTAPVLTEDTRAQLQSQLETAQKELADYEAQHTELLQMVETYSAQLEDLKNQKVQLEDQRIELLETKNTLDEAMAAIEMATVELESSQAQADNQFVAAQAKLDIAQLQLEEGQKELDAKGAELLEGIKALEEGQAELDQGFADYEAGEQEAQEELESAKQQLEDARVQLADARKLLDEMEPAKVYLLDRNTNAGYLALDNNSDIVAGVSKVFPAFFLLVAALVCITTMTRMVEEERTQIGIMKALGYSNSAIMGKYLWYAGSAAILGCGVGVLLGSAVFPMILWDAYGIILNVTPKIELSIHWPLSLTVVGVYTAVMLAVTWYCCRVHLKQVPAQLIRPKAPTSGRKIWLEYLPFWKKLSFLNKVMLRNVLRYRQRMFMMLVGIGGCTALLLTGFGLRDSIMNIVSEQFGNVTTYDMSVYFDKAQTPEDQQAFREDLRMELDDCLFYYQISTDLQFAGQEKDVSLISAPEEIGNYIHFNRDGKPLGVPGVGETYLSVGVAEAMGISVGDRIQLTDSDLRSLDLEVTGIFDNHVTNYAIILPQTLLDQWGEEFAPQMAFVNIRDTASSEDAAAKITGMEGVLNLTVTQETQRQVNGMLQALDAVVATVVVCAAALAMIVLYNLTNINITERIREIATLKVLGFYAGESAAYVFKENLLLSGMGTLVGLVGGKFLLDFVISEIQIDMIWFNPSFTVLSCILSVVLTMLSACLVDFLLYFKLEKINMAEALKSVE